MPPLFADVVFPDRISRPFTYRIPQALSGQLNIGQWVVAPLGSQSLPGFILSLSGEPPPPWPATPTRKIEIRELQDVLSTSSDFQLDPILLELAQWMSDYYLAPLGLCLQLIQPPQVPGKITSRVMLTEDGLAAAKIQRASTNTAKLLTYLAKKPKGLARSTLVQLVKNLDPVLARLKRQNLVTECYSIHPFKGTKAPLEFSGPLTRERNQGDRESSGELFSFFHPGLNQSSTRRQSASTQSINPLPSCWDTLRHGLAITRFQEFLVSTPWTRDPTVLRKSVEEILRQGKSALVISPDIRRASMIAQFFRATWGNQVGLIHSDLSESTKQAEWIAMSRGQIRIVVGTRLALFVPLPSLGLITLEDEDDPSYKDEQCPYYHARDVARQRAVLSGATLLLQSQHPSLETYAHFGCLNRDTAGVSHVGETGNSEIHVVDLRQTPYGTVLSHEMLEAVESSLQNAGGIVLYLNRKGFSSSLLCHDCGIGPECPHCHVSLNMFKPPPRLTCSYCGYTVAVPPSCPSCSSPRLSPTGIGTERLEEELKKHFPTSPIARLDRNRVRTRRADESVREKFRRGEIAILVGTQMLFHGDSLGPIRLMGIPYAESGLHIPDFRSAEHLYQHLQQAIDLVSTGPAPGEVIIQTRLPTHHAIEAIVQQNPHVFYEQELKMRQAMGYPPTTQLIQLSTSGTLPDRTKDIASQWATQLALKFTQLSASDPSMQEMTPMILGPIPLRGHRPLKRYQYQILIKAQASMLIRRIIQDTLDVLKIDQATRGIQFRINVDPVDML